MHVSVRSSRKNFVGIHERSCIYLEEKSTIKNNENIGVFHNKLHAKFLKTLNSCEDMTLWKAGMRKRTSVSDTVIVMKLFHIVQDFMDPPIWGGHGWKRVCPHVWSGGGACPPMFRQVWGWGTAPEIWEWPQISVNHAIFRLNFHWFPRNLH